MVQDASCSSVSPTRGVTNNLPVPAQMKKPKNLEPIQMGRRLAKRKNPNEFVENASSRIDAEASRSTFKRALRVGILQPQQSQRNVIGPGPGDSPTPRAVSRESSAMSDIFGNKPKEGGRTPAPQHLLQQMLKTAQRPRSSQLRAPRKHSPNFVPASQKWLKPLLAGQQALNMKLDAVLKDQRMTMKAEPTAKCLREQHKSPEFRLQYEKVSMINIVQRKLKQELMDKQIIFDREDPPDVATQCHCGCTDPRDCRCAEFDERYGMTARALDKKQADKRHQEYLEQDMYKFQIQSHEEKKYDEDGQPFQKQSPLNRKFVTGKYGLQVAKASFQIQPSQDAQFKGIVTGIYEKVPHKQYLTDFDSTVEKIQRNQFREFEKKQEPELTKKQRFYRKHKAAAETTSSPTAENPQKAAIKKAISTAGSYHLSSSAIEKSIDTKNYRIFKELEAKQEFFRIAKENTLANKNHEERQFYEKCNNTGVLALPAFCRSQEITIKKTLAPPNQTQQHRRIAVATKPGQATAETTAAEGANDGDEKDSDDSEAPGRVSARQPAPRDSNTKRNESAQGQQNFSRNLKEIAQTPAIGNNMKALQLTKYYLNEAVAAALGQQLSRPHQGVEALILNGNGLTDQGLQHILKGLQDQRCLESLNISNNQIGPKSIATLSDIFEFQDRNFQMQELRLSELQFVAGGTLENLMKALTESFYNGLLALKLNDLTLFDNALKEQYAFEHLKKYLSVNLQLTDLNLQNTGLQAEQLNHLINVIRTSNPSLRWLNLAENQMTHKPIEKYKEANDVFIENLCKLVENSQIQHLNMTQMNLGPNHLIEITEAMAKSKYIMGVHLCDNPALGQGCIKSEIFTILGINITKYQDYVQMRCAREIEAAKLFREERPGCNVEWAYQDLEPKEVNLVNNVVYQEEVQKGRSINTTYCHSEKNEFITSNFVLYRTMGHPEIKYESVLKNDADASYLVATDKWQVNESVGEGPGGSSVHQSCHIGRNRCYLCEKAPYTLFFYQREERSMHFTEITDQREANRIRETFFAPKALGSQFYAETHDVLMTGSMVHWDTVKLKAVEQYGMEINDGYFEDKATERSKAKKRRDKIRKGVIKPNEAIVAAIKEGRTGQAGQSSDVDSSSTNPLPSTSWRKPKLETTKDMMQYQKLEMIDNNKRKYQEVVKDYSTYTSWQEMLNRNLKIQNDQIHFVNTPNYKKYRPMQSFVGIMESIKSQIYIYSDYNLKPGKYSVLIYDCLDHTIWYKTVIVGFRLRQVIEPNIMRDEDRFDLKDELNYYHWPLKFPKSQYFKDFPLQYQQMPKKLARDIRDFADTHHEQLAEEAQQEAAITGGDEQDGTPDPAKAKQQRENDKEEYIFLMQKYYGLIKFVFTKFSQASTYPFVNVNDFDYFLKIFNFKSKRKAAKAEFALLQQQYQSAMGQPENLVNATLRTELQIAFGEAPEVGVTALSGQLGAQKQRTVKKQLTLASTESAGASSAAAGAPAIAHYVKSELDLFKTLMKLLSFADFKVFCEKEAGQCASEHLWNQFYDRSVFEAQNRQVMNMMFSNADNLKKLFIELKAGVFAENVRQLFVNCCDGDEWERLKEALQACGGSGEGSESSSSLVDFSSIPAHRFEALMAQSQFQFNPVFAPGILPIQNYIAESEEATGDSNASGFSLNFIEFMHFVAKVGQLQEYKTRSVSVLSVSDETGQSPIKHLKSPVDRIHKFLSAIFQEIGAATTLPGLGLDPGTECAGASGKFLSPLSRLEQSKQIQSLLLKQRVSRGRSMRKVNLMAKLGSVLTNPALGEEAKAGAVDINMETMMVRQGGKDIQPLALHMMNSGLSPGLADSDQHYEEPAQMARSKDFIPMLNRDQLYDFEDSYFYSDQSSDSDEDDHRLRLQESQDQIYRNISRRIYEIMY